MILLLLPILLALGVLFLSLGFFMLWWKARTPKPGKMQLVRTCDCWIARVGDEVTVRLWHSANDLPADERQLKDYRIILVLDHSGSMGEGPGSPLEHSREAAISFTENVVSNQCQVGVVEFDHQALTLHAVSSSKAALITALHQIPPGGGTDIACGLRQAQVTLQECSDPTEAERIVVLLSDGGSAEEPAILAAEVLKQEGVRVVVIGLGSYVNDRLLRRIASRDDDYFHTLDPANLARLYEIIRSSLDEIRAYRAYVNESVATEQFLLSATGESAPYEIAFEEGIVKWFMPFISARPKAIPYQIVPMHPGWHRIARKRATIEMVDRDGLSHRGESNLSPHLLVLPRGWWPWLAAFLNPLFWILWRRLFHRRRPQLTIQTPPLPEPIPVPKAEPVEAAIRLSQKGKVSPVLIVGIGFAGSLMIRAMRYHMHQLVPPPEGIDSIRYLWIDTGVDSEDDIGNWAPFGEPVPETDRVLMRENVQPLFEMIRGIATPPPHLAWLDVERERQTLVAKDYDMSRGTARRRVLGRVALYQHLEGGREAVLDKALRERLCSLRQPYRVILTGNIAGGTAGGMLMDLAIYTRKLFQELGHDNVNLDMFLLTHRTLDNVTGPEYFRNTLVFAAELSRLSLRRHLSLYFPQKPEEDTSSHVIKDLVDSIMLFDHPLEPPSDRTRWPGPVAHSAAEVILQLVMDEGRGPTRFLNNQLGATRALERSTGNAVVFGAGSTSRWLPMTEGRHLFTSQMVFEFLAREFLLLEKKGESIAPERSKDLLEAIQEQVTRLLQGSELSRPLPTLLQYLPLLANSAAAPSEVSRLIQEMHVFPGSTGVPIDVGGNALMAEILKNQQTLLVGLLEEWALYILNGKQDSGKNPDPGVRRGAFFRLAGAVERLLSYCEDSIKNLNAMEESIRRADDLRRFEFIRYLFIRYRGAVSALNKHVAAWTAMLLSTVEQADKTAALAQRNVREVLDELSPYAQWPQELVAKYGKPAIREELLKQVMWTGVPSSDDLFRLRLRVLGTADERFQETLDQVPQLLSGLRELVPLVELKRGLDYTQEDISQYLDLGAWSATRYTDPIGMDQNTQMALVSKSMLARDFLIVHSGSEMSATGQEVIASPHRHRASILRILSGCALNATTAVLDYERRTLGEPHSKLPFLDPVDRLAAACEDRFLDFGLNAPLLCPAIRVYFENLQMIRAFALAHAVGLLVLKIGAQREVLFFDELALTDEYSDQRSYPWLMQALDNFVIRGQSADRQPLDVITVKERVDREVTVRSSEVLKKLAGETVEMQPLYLQQCPSAMRGDFLRVVQLFLQLELDRRLEAATR